MQNNLFQQMDSGANPTPPLHIQQISYKEALSLISICHYLGAKRFRCSVAFGLIDNNALVGVAVYHGLSAPETAVGAFGLQRNQQNGLWEIGRLVLRSDYNGKNYGSYFIRKSIMLLKKKYPIRAIIAYADSTCHRGAIYQAAGFTYCGLTAPKKDYFLGGKIQERGKTKGINGEWRTRSRKHRYIIVLDKSLNLKWPILPYPKGNLCQNV